MIGPEQLKRMVDGAKDFYRARRGDVSIFILVGTPINQKMLTEYLVAIYPESIAAGGSPIVQIPLVTTPANRVMEYYAKILQLKVPPRVQNLRILEDNRLRLEGERKSALNHEPYAVIGFGEFQQTSEKAVLLVCIAGVSPVKVLEEMKHAARQQLHSFQ